MQLKDFKVDKVAGMLPFSDRSWPSPATYSTWDTISATDPKRTFVNYISH